MAKTHGTVLLTLHHCCLITLKCAIMRVNVSPVPVYHQVKFVAYGPDLIGISLVIPTAPTMLACGSVTDIFRREWRVG